MKAKKSLTIDNIFMIKHIDFVEIAGDVNNVMIIGFRKSQSLTSDQDIDQHASKFGDIT